MPTVTDVRKAKVAMKKRRADYEYFFSQLKSPNWIPPLLEEGFLKDPPLPEPVDKGRFVRFPFWPESQYLARVAAQAPDLVVAVAAKIQSDNPRVQEDIVEIALRVSPEQAVRLVPSAIKWTQNPYSRWITDKFNKLVQHLAKGGQTDCALTLAKEILWFDPDPKLAEKEAERAESEAIFGTTPDPQPRTEQWEYERVLKKAIPALAELDVTETLNLLSSVLTRHIQLSGFDRESHRPYDGSAIWRPAIEAGRWHQDYRDLLVDAIRDIAEGHIRDKSGSFEAVESSLLSHNWDIFTRIWLYLIRKFPALAHERVARALTDKRFFSDPEFTHEYFYLIQQSFTSLNDGSKQQILGWIERGPDEKLLKAFATDWNGNPVGQDIIDRRIKAWKREKLHPIRDFLTSDWRALYDELIAEFGEPRNADQVVFQGEPEWGPKSPKSEEELSALNTDAIVSFLQSWRPEEGSLDPSPEGLARSFQKVVKGRPKDLSEVADRFEKLDPTYARALISGLSDAVKEGKQITWRPVLDLCRWILSQPVEIPGRSKKDRRWDEGDPDWTWTRQSIARLLRDECERVPADVPFECRAVVWDLISILTNDESPSADDEQNQGASFKPITRSINTTRGEAMHAVMAYASWIRRQLGKDNQANFRLMPEVAKLLEKRLDVQVEPTLTIRSVYGQNLARLIWIDPDWVRQHLENIFPRNRELRDHWDIAWSSYVIFNQCYSWAYDILKEQYAEAIRRLSDGGLPTQEANPNESLTDHLMILYWMGHLKLDDAALAEFYHRASEDLRAHALEFVGRALKNCESVPSHQIERLKALWENRLTAHTKNGNKKPSKELSKFATWFWSGKFDDEWALDQLIASMKTSEDIEREFFVLERLTQLSERMPQKSLTALDLLIKSTHKKRGYFHGQDEAKVIIQNAVRSSDTVAQKKGREIANYLLSLRYSEFRELAK